MSTAVSTTTHTQVRMTLARLTNGAFPLHGTARYGTVLLLGGFPLGTVPGT